MVGIIVNKPTKIIRGLRESNGPRKPQRMK